MIDTLSLALGIDIPIPELQLTLHQPKLKDIAFMTEEKFFSAVQYLCLDKSMLVQDESLLGNLTNFQVLLKILEQPDAKSKKQDLATLMLILFPERRFLITPTGMILADIQNPDANIALDDEKFDILQSVLREVLCVSNLFQGQNVVYKPMNKAAQRIAEKIMAGRRKVAQLKSDGKKTSVLGRYVSILNIGTQTSIEQSQNYTLFYLFDQIERYQLKMEWDIDLKVRLAGGTPQSQPKNWMDDLYSNS